MPHDAPASSMCASQLNALLGRHDQERLQQLQFVSTELALRN
jgi:hypothetical protein